MKRILLLISMAFIATSSLFAQDYNQSFGLVAGSLNGLSYKKFVKENVAIQTDLAFGLLATRFTEYDYYSGYSVSGEGHLWNFQLQPNLYYQNNVLNGNNLNIGAFIGGGVSLGYAQGFYNDLPLGKWGINAIAGIEFILNKTPLTIGLDFRPGYGMLFTSNQSLHMFDWALAASVRYCF